jgi:hypothetical protein
MIDILQVKDRISLELNHSGMDSFAECMNKTHFNDYKKSIHYQYNSKGFRDSEWPADIENKIWCVGDSFTVGLGQPYEETWPQILEQRLGERCINVSEDGCSNDLMSMRIEQIKKFNPKCIVVMWSYFWRRWIDNTNVHFDVNNRELPKDDLENFLKNLQSANNDSQCKILNYVIPDCMIESTTTWTRVLGIKSKKNINRLIAYHYPGNKFPVVSEIEQIDYARDGHHFDVLTCERIVGDILTKY